MSKDKIKKCEECVFFIKNGILDTEIEKAKQIQEYYLTQVRRVNETLAKYDKKTDELDKQKGK